MNSLFELGAEVARLRKLHGLSQAALAKQAGMGQSTLARFETGGVAEFGSRKLLRLLELLDFEMQFVPTGTRPTLDSVLAERRSGSGS